MHFFFYFIASINLVFSVLSFLLLFLFSHFYVETTSKCKLRYSFVVFFFRSFKIEFLSLFLLGHNVKTILHTEHHVVGQSVNPRFGATLAIDGVLQVAYLRK